VCFWPVQRRYLIGLLEFVEVLIDNGILRNSPYVRYGFLLMCYSNFVRQIFLIFDFKNAVTLKSRLRVSQGHWKLYHSIDWVCLPIVLYSNFDPKSWDIRLVTKYSDLEIHVRVHSRSSEPTYWSATYDFLLTFHSNHGPISYRFRDNDDFSRKSQIFPTLRVFWVGSRSRESRFLAARSGAARYRASRFRTNDAVVRACSTVTRPAKSRLATLRYVFDLVNGTSWVQ